VEPVRPRTSTDWSCSLMRLRTSGLYATPGCERVSCAHTSATGHRVPESAPEALKIPVSGGAIQQMKSPGWDFEFAVAVYPVGGTSSAASPSTPECSDAVPRVNGAPRPSTCWTRLTRASGRHLIESCSCLMSSTTGFVPLSTATASESSSTTWAPRNGNSLRRRWQRTLRPTSYD